MIYEADLNTRKKLFPMFQNMHDTIILSCLQRHMGTAWVDDLENPTVAQVIVGDFVFYAGNPYAKEVEALLYNLPENILAIVDTKEWKSRIETVHKGSTEKFQRYKFKKNPEDLDRKHLQIYLSTLPVEYELKRIDETLAKEPSLHEISEDFTGQFDSLDDYINRGVGFCVLYKGQVVCGASSYSIYDGGIEIEIGTHPKYRRHGLATIAAAALIIDCLDNGLYPSWDAANPESVKLAQKRGYILDEPYDTYYINYKNSGFALKKGGAYFLNRIDLIRKEEKEYHDYCYKNYKLFAKGSWLHKPVKTVLDLLPYFAGRESVHVLDLGSGVGRNSIPIAQAIKSEQSKVVCVDMLDSSLQKLQEYSQVYGVEKIISTVKRDIGNMK